MITMKKPFTLLICALLPAAVLLLTGFNPLSKDIRLVNLEGPLINLSEFVIDSDPGKGQACAETSPKETQAGAQKESAAETAPESKADETNPAETAAPVRTELIITVTDRQISFDHRSYDTAAKAISAVRKEYKKGMKVKLCDDYAEAGTYRAMKKALEDASITFSQERLD